MERVAILQRIAKRKDDSYSLAYSYLSIILSLNDIHITKRQCQLLSFIAINGISSERAKKEFCDLYKSSRHTINNIISQLTELKLLTKEDRKVRVIQQLSLDFTKDIVLNISLSHAHR